MDRTSLNIAVCQLNAIVGDIETNKNKIINVIKDPNYDNVTLFIFPELFLSGYIPLDDLYISDFMDRIDNAIQDILEQSNGKALVFGAPRKIRGNNKDNLFYNSAFVISDNEIIRIIDKVLLPNYDVFHEKRYFTIPIIPFELITPKS